MADESYRTATVQGREVPYDPEQLRKISEHPCYSDKACHSFGRCHLPVAPKCNIQCNYCVRDFDCVNESRPGVTSRVLPPEEALDHVRKVMKEHPYVKVIGIAGPGEPLANPETFEALRLVHEEFPNLIMCISTNGLMLPESIEELAKYDVGNVTVTLNAIDPAIGEKIYSWVDYKGKKYHGREAAELLLSQQMKGIEMAVAKKMFVKINTVYIPGINDEHIPEIAKKVGEMGAFTLRHTDHPAVQVRRRHPAHACREAGDAGPVRPVHQADAPLRTLPVGRDREARPGRPVLHLPADEG